MSCICVRIMCRYVTKKKSVSHSLTTLMPSDLAEPTMLLTTFCMEASCSLKHSSCALTFAISYTALTDTIPAVSCPSEKSTELVKSEEIESDMEEM